MEKANAFSNQDATILRGAEQSENLHAKGLYEVECFDGNGKLKWSDHINNTVTNIGANQLLNSAFGSGPVAGPFLGLISSVGYTGVPAVTDTMSSHPTWNEAGNGSNFPLWSTPASNARASVTFAAASNRIIALPSKAQFIIATTGGTVKGAFLVFGTGAVATNNDTNGSLYSAGLFAAGDKVVSVGDTLQVSYQTSV